MSLVNDVLIEAERRRGGSRRARGVALEGLVPTRRNASSASEASGARRYLFVLGLATGLAAIVAGAIFAPIGLAPVAAADPLETAALAATPAVAARGTDALPESESGPATPAPSASGPAAIGPAAPSLVATRRPARIESISVERTPTATRLRLVTDRVTPHRIEHDAAGARLDIVLTSSSLVESNAPLELLDTPIRSLDVRAESPDLRLALELDPEVRVESRWLELPMGAVLVVDLQATPRSIPDDAQGSVDGLDGLDGLDLLEPEIVRVEPASIVDQVISPPLGNPAELRIERSRQDRVRADRAALRDQVEQTLDAARRARAEKRFDEADGLYAEIVLLAPSDRLALVEWAELLVEDGRPDKAIALIESARTQAPRDATLLLAHARLLGRQGDLKRAVEILDGSGLAVTESPDVHVLAAAYHQRAGDHATAIERYEQILRRFPEESRGWLGLGISLEASGRRDEARDVYRIALQVGELPTGSRRWLSTRLSALGQED